MLLIPSRGQANAIVIWDFVNNKFGFIIQLLQRIGMIYRFEAHIYLDSRKLNHCFLIISLYKKMKFKRPILEHKRHRDTLLLDGKIEEPI